jgi:hypothetical protein
MEGEGQVEQEDNAEEEEIGDENEITEHLEVLREVLEGMERRRQGFDIWNIGDASMMFRASLERIRHRRLEMDERKPNGGRMGMAKGTVEDQGRDSITLP